MCSVYGQSPCHPRCPNSSQEEVINPCPVCGARNWDYIFKSKKWDEVVGCSECIAELKK